jgi:hypothetical protein
MIGNAISRLLDDKDELDMILARLVAGEVIHLHDAEPGRTTIANRDIR